MNFLRRLFHKKTSCYTYIVAPSEEWAISALGATVSLHGGLTGFTEAIQEQAVRGGNIYCICISIERKVKLRSYDGRNI